MAQSGELAVKRRDTAGKGAARTLRREGKLPGVIYGRGRPSEAIVVEKAALKRLLAKVSASSTLVDVTVDDAAPVTALIRELQRNPIRPDDILHIDLYEVHAGEEIELAVPIHLTGIPDGVRNAGGVLDHSLRELDIKVLPRDIPESVELDVTALEIGDALYVRDIQIANAEIMNEPHVTVCSVVAPRAIEEPTPVAEGELEAVAEEEEAAEPELIRKPKPEEEPEDQS